MFALSFSVGSRITIQAMPFATLPITHVFLIAFVFAILIALSCLSGFRPSRRAILMYVVLAVLLTLASLLIVGSRGGEPPSKIYGWPKEFLAFRGWSTGYFAVRDPQGPYFRFFHLIVDVAFYAIVSAGIDSARFFFGKRS